MTILTIDIKAFLTPDNYPEVLSKYVAHNNKALSILSSYVDDINRIIFVSKIHLNVNTVGTFPTTKW
jgi:hypothetical protein